MKISFTFVPEDAIEIDRLIAAHPFAQLVSCNGLMPVCTPLPLLLHRDGEQTWLIGHFARANPHVAMLREHPQALAVFMGEHAYMSPSWLRDRTQAPTWNYETVHCEVEVEFLDHNEAIHAALEELVTHMETGRESAWGIADMGPRYEQLSRAVIAFRARITAIHPKFKLGQNERDDVYADMLAGAERDQLRGIAGAMRRIPRRARG